MRWDQILAISGAILTVAGFAITIRGVVDRQEAIRQFLATRIGVPLRGTIRVRGVAFDATISGGSVPSLDERVAALEQGLTRIAKAIDENAVGLADTIRDEMAAALGDVAKQMSEQQAALRPLVAGLSFSRAEAVGLVLFIAGTIASGAGVLVQP